MCVDISASLALVISGAKREPVHYIYILSHLAFSYYDIIIELVCSRVHVVCLLSSAVILLRHGAIFQGTQSLRIGSLKIARKQFLFIKSSP